MTNQEAIDIIKTDIEQVEWNQVEWDYPMDYVTAEWLRLLISGKKCIVPYKQRIGLPIIAIIDHSDYGYWRLKE